MALIDDIRSIIEKIFVDEELKSNFLDSATVKGIVDDNYLTPEFSDYDEFEDDPTGLDFDLGKEYNEINRRKKWTGKLNNSSRSPGSARTKQMEYFVGNPFPEGTGAPSFMKKPEVREVLPDLTLRLIYDLVKKEDDLGRIIILLNALLGKTFLTDKNYDEKAIQIYDFIPLIRLDK